MNEETLFELAVNAPPASRAALLDRECGGDAALRARVEALLGADDRAAGTRSAGPEGPTTAALPPGGLDAPGRVVAGRYKLLQQIGEGGMGTVWMADQTDPVKRRVAVKVIRAERGHSKTILARFEAERQAIALMDHPNIAKLLDAGTTAEGSPYFVMELVKGVPLTEYCDAHRLSVPERLNLFRVICSAVQHAHQKGIIHRDLKPTNVLVENHDGRPVPKVIDFGLAKATGGLHLTDHTLFTGFGTVLGTPLYMAPEQANFNAVDVDTRADVYALGVILYELLTGTTPLTRETFKKAAFDEVMKLVREQEAPTPSSRLTSSGSNPSIAANRQTEPAKLGRFVKGELDWIAMKALSKERDRRYETADAFAKDVGRFLDHEPVAAGPPGAGYRLRKLVRRNRPQVVAAGMVAFALVAGIVGTTLGLFEAKRQERIAVAEAAAKEEARKKTREALDTLTSDALEGWFTREQSLSAEQKDVLRRLLDQYAAFADEGGDRADARPGQVRALLRVGRIQRALGDRPAAGATFRRAAELAGTAAAPLTADAAGWNMVSDAHNALAGLLQADGAVSGIVDHYREALAAQSRARDADPAAKAARFRSAALRVSLAGALADREKYDEADAEHRAAAAELERLIADYPRDAVLRENLAVLLYNRARAAQRRGQLADALVYNRRALDLQRRAAAETPDQVWVQKRLLLGLRQQSELFSHTQRPTDAEAVRREAIRVGLSLSRAFPSVPEYRIFLANDYWSLSHALTAQGRHGEAADEAGRGLAVIRQVVADFPDDRPVRFDLISALAARTESFLGIRKLKEAEAAAREALVEIDRLAALGENPDGLLYSRSGALRGLANALRTQGRSAEARAATADRLAALTRLVRLHPDRGDFLRSLLEGRFDSAITLVGQRDPEAAIAELRAVAADIDRLPADEQGRLRSSAALYLAKAHAVAGRWAETEAAAGQAVEAFAVRLRQNPTVQENRGFLTQAHWHRATAREKLGRHPGAAADWAAAADLADDPMDAAFYRAHRAAALGRGGDAKGAAPEFTAAVQQAEKILKGGAAAGVTVYDAAAVYALAAGGSTDPAAAEKLAAEAVRLLQQSAAAGFLTDPAQLAALRTADEYAALHGRKDYESILADPDKKKAKAPAPGPTK